ncbi:MAG: histidine kinase dimerization/phosphoacceptor domain -containing protein [Bacteroidales bacterium]|nr:histidine kinase dimerization/phosphoacceptor domain -containing protein [Bacteroidales bacterium]
MGKQIQNENSPDELRKQAEEIVGKQGDVLPEKIETLLLSRVQTLIHELKVHQIELEMQNEELRQTQGDLLASKSRYFDLYNLAPVGYCTLDNEGIVLEVNLTAAKMLGVGRSVLTGKPLTRFILPEDQDIFYLYRKQISETDSIQVCELRMEHKKGTPIWTRFQTTRLEDHDGVTIYPCTIIDISDRKKVETDLLSALKVVKEKEVLLLEVHHRVKNNLQVICSLLSITSHRVIDQKMKDILTESYNRIRAIALVHDKIYGDSTVAAINLKEYVDSLVHDLYSAYSSSAKKIIFHTEIDSVTIPLSVAVPCGLILNEFISNSLKYAFPDNFKAVDDPGVFISTKILKDDNLLLSFRDNGIGLPHNYDISDSSSLGLYLIKILAVDQLNGKLTINSDNGTHYLITFNPWQKPSDAGTK